MSAPSPLSAALLAAWRGTDIPRELAVRVDVTDPSAKSYFWAYKDLKTPDGQRWDPLLTAADPVDAPGVFLSPGFDECSTSFSVVNLRRPDISPTECLASDLARYRFQGARVRAWLVVPGVDWGQHFEGRITDYVPGLDEIRFLCVQDRTWNRTVNVPAVDRGRFPRAPEKSQASVLTLAFGDGKRPAMRGDWDRINGPGPVYGPFANDFDHLGGAIPTVQGMLVDTGRGGGVSNPPAKVLLTGHKCKLLNSGQSGCNSFMRGEGSLPFVVEPAVGDQVNATDEAGFKIPDEAAIVYVPVLGADVKAVTDPADNPRALLDLSNEARYALFDYDNSKRNLTLLMPTVEPAGRVVEVRMIVGYRSFGSIDTFEIIYWNTRTGVGVILDDTSGLVANTLSTASRVVSIPTPEWNFGETEIRCGFTGAGTSTGDRFQIYFLGLQVKCVPKQTVLRNEKVIQTVTRTHKRPRRKWGQEPDITTTEQVEVSQPISEMEGEFYGNLHGREDSGSPVNVDSAATYTGTANALIKRPPDIAHCILRNYASIASGSIETGAGEHGSFPDARAKLKTWNQRDIEFFLTIDSTQSAEEALSQLAKNALSWWHISRFNGKHKWVVWEKDPAVSYDYVIEPEDCLDLELLDVRMGSDAHVINGVRISYLWDAFRQRFVSESSSAKNRSIGGYKYQGLRDGNTEVIASVNDKVDWSYAANNYSATLTPGKRDPMALAQHVAAQMEAQVAALFKHGWGPTVVAGYNDKISFNDGSARVATIPAGAYSSFEAMLAEATIAMNAVSSNWSCSFSRLLRKVTISRSSGTAQLWTSGSFADLTAQILLGFKKLTALTGASSYTAPYEREEERFYLGDLGGVSPILVVRLETGTNGLNGTGSRFFELMGFDPMRDLEGEDSYLGVCPKNRHEEDIDLAETRWGPKREWTLEARHILDSDTAREIKLRALGLHLSPRMGVRFSTLKTPDLERGRVLQFSSRFDKLKPYSEPYSDGSWVGKKFWAIGARQHQGPERWFTEVTCVRA
jgi:hypothetical protein